MAKVKSYMNPNIPKPTPGKPGKGNGRIEVGGPGWRDINFPGGGKGPVGPKPSRPGRPVPKPLPNPGKTKPGKKAIPQPYQIGPNDMPSSKIPGRKTIMPVPRKTISSMGRKKPIARKGGGR